MGTTLVTFFTTLTTLLLILLLVFKVLVSAQGGKRQPWEGALNLTIIPLLLIFCLTLAIRLYMLS